MHANGGPIQLDEMETLILRLNNHDPSQFQAGNLQHNDGPEVIRGSVATDTEEAPVGMQPVTCNAATQTLNENMDDVISRRITRSSRKTTGM